MLARAVALIFALALVGAAFWYRTRSEGETEIADQAAESPAEPATDSGDGGEGEREGSALVICDAVVADACRAVFEPMEGVELRVEQPGDTLAAIVAGETTPRAWVAAEAWLAMAANPTVNRNGRPESPTALASAPLLVAAADGGCSAWGCAADAVQAGDRIGLDSFRTSAGVTEAAVLTAERFGSAADLSTVSTGWRSNLAAAAQATTGRSAVQVMVVQRGTYDIALTDSVTWSGIARQGVTATDPEPPGGPANSDNIVMAVSSFAGEGNEAAFELDPDALAAKIAESDGWTATKEPTVGLPIDAGLLWSLTQGG